MKGAQRAAVTQSAISTSIAKIEAELGVKWIDRRLSTVGLTPAGKRLLEAGKDILQRYDALTAELKCGTDPKYPRIGVLRSLLHLMVLFPIFSALSSAPIPMYPPKSLTMSVSN